MPYSSYLEGTKAGNGAMGDQRLKPWGRGWGEDSVGKGLAVQAGGPEFRSHDVMGWKLEPLQCDRTQKMSNGTDYQRQCRQDKNPWLPSAPMSGFPPVPLLPEICQKPADTRTQEATLLESASLE